MKRKTTAIVVCLTLVITAFAIMPANVSAADEEDIEASIVAGLAWLAEQQNEIDGSWGASDRVGRTAFAVLKMEDRAIELGYDTPFDPEYEYSDEVEAGLNFIFDNAYDFATDEIYLADDTGGWYHHWVYETSIAIMAIASSTTPDRVVDVPGSFVDGWTYEEVVEDAVNYLINAQRSDGGWGYGSGTQYPFGDRSDNSNTGWVTLALIFAQNKFGIDVESVKTDLDSWIDFIQNDPGPGDDGAEDNPDGGSGYTHASNWVNLLKTGNLLFQMAFVGDDSETVRAQAAIDYIEAHWNDANWDPGWKGLWPDSSWPHYQAMYTMMKGFEAMGIETITIGMDEIDWFEVFSDAIVDTQTIDGYWNPDKWGDEELATCWALLTLERVVEIPTIQVYVDIKPGSCPNPINLKKKGVLPVAICGTEDFDVTTIDPESILLTREGYEDVGVSPLRWSYEDVATPYTGDEECGCHDLDGDGYLDLSLKFKNKEVVETLDIEDVVGEVIPLIITGNLKEEEGGTPIKGQDCVWVLGILEKSDDRSFIKIRDIYQLVETLLQRFPLLRLLLSYLIF